MSSDDLIRRALRAVPDRPRWIEARAILLSGCCSVFESQGGFAIRNDASGGGLVALVGRPAPERIARALSDRPERELLCAAEDDDWLAEHFPSWTRRRAVLHELADAARLVPASEGVRVLREEDELAHVLEDLREELEEARAARTVHAVFTDDRAVCFAYAFWRTERWFDLSIDTLPDYRRRGLAKLAASALIRAEARDGRRPVWGALLENEASLRLARALGFVAVDEIVIATRDRAAR
ncbi:MAG: GNAT family N-acetyltransferase [Planctomycetes bacterium]|nr:GNAT family N-acetyltransferase [Planctomycetota bacterium]MCB9905300.1 GNAT family N-acetyltransferase [Planctomycetota bacterium]